MKKSEIIRIAAEENRNNVSGNEPVAPKSTSDLIDEGVRRAVKEYGEVLRRLANE